MKFYFFECYKLYIKIVQTRSWASCWRKENVIYWIEVLNRYIIWILYFFFTWFFASNITTRRCWLAGPTFHNFLKPLTVHRSTKFTLKKSQKFDHLCIKYYQLFEQKIQKNAYFKLYLQIVNYSSELANRHARIHLHVRVDIFFQAFQVPIHKRWKTPHDILPHLFLNPPLVRKIPPRKYK